LDNPLKRPKILIVDDEPDITFTFRKILERVGFDVDTYNDSLMALREFKHETYDILLIDIKMPNISGLELYKKITKIDSRQKVCFVTAFDRHYEEFRRLLPTMNVDYFLRKPIEGNELVAQVRMRLATNGAKNS
jgi:DNA-binding response OmpR family regulator